MTQSEILSSFKLLPFTEQLEVLVEAAHILQERAQQAEEGVKQQHSSEKEQLAAAAQLLLPDYLADEELTAFTVLDGEPFYA